jgi:hypothetical protein
MTPDQEKRLEELRQWEFSSEPEAPVISDLLAMVDTLREELAGWHKGNEGIEVWKRVNRKAMDRAYEAEAERDTLRAENERLRSALQGVLSAHQWNSLAAYYAAICAARDALSPETESQEGTK